MQEDPGLMQEMQVQSLGQEDLLEEGMATHSNILAWRTSVSCLGQKSLAGYGPWGHKRVPHNLQLNNNNNCIRDSIVWS